MLSAVLTFHRGIEYRDRSILLVFESVTNAAENLALAAFGSAFRSALTNIRQPVQKQMIRIFAAAFQFFFVCVCASESHEFYNEMIFTTSMFC